MSIRTLPIAVWLAWIGYIFYVRNSADRYVKRMANIQKCSSPIQPSFRSMKHARIRSVNLRALFVVSSIAACLTSPMLHGQRNLSNATSYQSNAVDAKGVQHYASDYPRHRNPPWIDDLLEGFTPSYPRADRASHHEGTGLFRLILDLKTGSVAAVTKLKSTGFVTLDGCAVESYRRWRWKPGKWKEITIPITFKIIASPVPPALNSWGRYLPPLKP